MARPGVIETQADLDRAAQALAAQAPELRALIAELSPLPLRRNGGGFAALLSAIVGQQVSTASARAIWARLHTGGLTTEAAVAKADETTLRGYGLSRPKARYAQALACAGVDWAALQSLPNSEVLARLTAVPGVGPWTAQIYLLQSLGRADVFPDADLALQEAARRALDLADRPKAAEMARIAQAWSPYRAVAARALWAYYRAETGREGASP